MKALAFKSGIEVERWYDCVYTNTTQQEKNQMQAEQAAQLLRESFYGKEEKV